MANKDKDKYVIELVDEVSAKLKKINSALNNNEKNFKSTGKSAKGFGSSVDGTTASIGKFLPGLIGIGAAALAAKKALDFTTKAVFNFSGASAKLKAIVQPTVEQFESLEAAALKYGSTTSFTASQVLDAYTEQAKLGQTVNEILASGSAVLDLAAASQIGLAEAATITTQTLNQFGLGADQTNRVVDVMGKAFTTSALDAEKFAKAMEYAGTIGAVSGDSIEDVSAALGVLADRAIESSQAGTATRRVMVKLANANSKASKAIAATGQKAGTFVEKLKVLKSLNLTLTDTTSMFGLLSATAATVLIGAADDVRVLSDAYKKADGTMNQMADTMLDSLPGAVTKMTSALEGLALTSRNLLTPALTTIINQVTDLAQGWTYLFSQKDIKKQEEMNTRIIEEVKALKGLRSEYESIRDTQLALQAQKGSLFSPDTLQDALNNIETVNDAIKDLNTDVQAIASGGVTAPKDSKTTVTQEIKTKSSGGDDANEKLKAYKKMSEGIIQIQQQTALMTVSGQEKELLSLDQWLSNQKSKYKGHAEFLEALTVEYTERKATINAAYMEQEAEKEQELQDKRKAWMDEIAQKHAQQIEERKQKEQEMRMAYVNTTIDSGKTISNAMFTIGQQRTNYEKKQQIDRIKNSKKSETEKAKLIESIERQSFEKNKKRSIAQAILNGALGATKTIANLGFPAAIPALILQGAVTAANIAVIASQKFAKGGVVQKEPGKSVTGDQHLIAANPGEMVLTKEQQKGIGTSVNIGDTNVIVQGNVTQESLNQIDQTLEDRNEQLKQTLIDLTEAGQIAGVTF